MVSEAQSRTSILNSRRTECDISQKDQIKFPDTNPNRHPRAPTHFTLSRENARTPATRHLRLVTTWAVVWQGSDTQNPSCHERLSSRGVDMVEGKHPQNTEQVAHRMRVTKSRKSKRRKMGKTGAKDKQESQGTRKRAGSTKRGTEVEVKARSTKRGNGSQKSNT